MKALVEKWAACPACGGRQMRGRDADTKQLVCSCGARFLPRPASPADRRPPALQIAIVADSHFDRRPNGRLAECVRIHDWIADDMDRRGIELALLSGDLYEGDSAPADRNPAAAWVQRLAQGRPVVVVRGNHDPPGDLEILTRLEADHEIVVEERFNVHYVEHDSHAEEVAVACMAYPRKGWLLASQGAKSHEQTSVAAVEALRAVLRGMGAKLRDHPGPRILLTHAMVRGSKTSTGQPLAGMDMEVGLVDLGLVDADAVALGHVHKHQFWSWNGAPIIYPGSPRRTKYGEKEGKGYVVLYFDLRVEERARLREWAWIPTPAQRMIHAEEEWVLDGLDAEGKGGPKVPGWRPRPANEEKGIELLADVADEIPGADIRFRYDTTDQLRESAREAAVARKRELEAAGAARVKLDPVIAPTVRKRSKAFAQAQGMEDKLVALWAEQGRELSDEQKARAFTKLEQLELEVPR